jgi:tetratricopeptide (TPR) repeat protein
VAATVISSRSARPSGHWRRNALPERIANAVDAYAVYLAKMVWPVSLAIFYPHRHGRSPPSSWALAAAAVLALLALAVAFVRKAPWITFGVLWYLVTLVPVLGLVQVGGQSMADRYTYVPLIGIFVAVVWTLAAAAERETRVRAPLAVAAGAAILALVLVTGGSSRTGARTRPSTSARSRSPRATGSPTNNLGLALFEEGKKDEAIAHYREALTYLPAYPHALAKPRLRARRSRRLRARDRSYERAVKLDPDDARK